MTRQIRGYDGSVAFIWPNIFPCWKEPPNRSRKSISGHSFWRLLSLVPFSPPRDAPFFERESNSNNLCKWGRNQRIRVMFVCFSVIANRWALSLFLNTTRERLRHSRYLVRDSNRETERKWVGYFNKAVAKKETRFKIITQILIPVRSSEREEKKEHPRTLHPSICITRKTPRTRARAKAKWKPGGGGEWSRPREWWVAGWWGMEGSPELTDQFVQKISPLESREEASRSAAMDNGYKFNV